MPATLAEYPDLADWTGRSAHPGKCVAIDAATSAVLRKKGLREEPWHMQTTGIEQRNSRAAGAVDSLLETACRIGQRWRVRRRCWHASKRSVPDN